MKRYTRVFIRPHNEVEFYTPQASFMSHIQSTYIDTGKCTKFREATWKDEDQLVIQLVSEWSDDMTIEQAEGDAVWSAERDRELEYNTACEIICLERTFEEV